MLREQQTSWQKEEVLLVQDGKHSLIIFERLCIISAEASSCLLLCRLLQGKMGHDGKEEIQIRIDAGDKELVAEEKAWCTKHIK